MTPAGFTQPPAPDRPIPIWVVGYFDKYAEKPERRIAAAFTSEDEATKLLHQLQRLGGSEAYQYDVEATKLHTLSEDWRPDPADRPYDTIPGLKKAKVALPGLKGHQCLTVNRISQQFPNQAPKTRGLQIGWRTGAQLQLGVDKPGTMLITQKSWTNPSDSGVSVSPATYPELGTRWGLVSKQPNSLPSQNPLGINPRDTAKAAGIWSSDGVEPDDPLAILKGKRVHAFSVTENDDGSIGAIRLRFTGATLVVRVQDDQFLVDLSGPVVTIDPKVLSHDKAQHRSYETFVVTSESDPAVVAALTRAAERFMCVDETGTEHADIDSAEDADLYALNYVSAPEVTEKGVRVYVDCKGSIADPMGKSLRAILREELERARTTARVEPVI